MGEKFKKIKRAALLVRLGKALSVGGAVGLLALGILLLLRRFAVWNTTLPVVLAIGIGGGVLAAAVALLLLRRSDKRLAVWLDEHHGLDERVQTVLAFEGEEGAMLTLLRADTEARMAQLGRTLPGVKRLWIYLLCFVLSAALFGASFAWKPAPPPPPDPEEEVPFAVTELQLMALSELIASVETSEMAEPYRADTVAALTALQTDIVSVTTVAEKDERVSATMQEILLFTDQSSPSVELMNALWAKGTTGAKLLAKALNHYENDSWEKLSAGMTDFRLGFTPLADESDEPARVTEMQNSFLAVAQNITATLKEAGVAEDSLLHTTLTRLAIADEKNADGTRVLGLLTLAEYVNTEGVTKAERELEATLTALLGDVYQAVSREQTNTTVGERAITTLSTIFDVDAPAFRRPLLADGSEGEIGEGEGGGGGGIGGGPTYGSGDKVYDPFTNRYVEYGTILDKYYGMMFSKLNGGSYTDEEKAALEEYFKILYGGFDQEKN